MTFFGGADLSLTGSGLVIIDESGKIIASQKLTTEARGTDRLFLLEKSLNKFLDENERVDLFCIEGGSFGSVGRLFDIGEWAGVFKLNLYHRGIKFVIATPSQLKLFISGSGKSGGKEIVILDVFKNYGVELRDDNIADAFVLSQIARSFKLGVIDGRNLNLKDYQIKTLKKIYDSDQAVSKSLI